MVENETVSQCMLSQVAFISQGWAEWIAGVLFSLVEAWRRGACFANEYTNIWNYLIEVYEIKK